MRSFGARSRLVEIVQKRLRRPEVRGIEPLGEPVVNLPQQRHPVGGPALMVQQMCKARGGAQFPGQRALPARPVERLTEVILGRCRGAGRPLQQQQFALDAQQLGDVPAFVGLVGARDRLQCSRLPRTPMAGTRGLRPRRAARRRY